MSAFKKKIATTKGKIYLIFWGQYWIVAAYIFFSHTQEFFKEAEDRPGWVIPLYIGIIIFWAFCAIYCFYGWLASKRKRDERGKEIKSKIRLWHFAVIAFICTYCFLSMELMNNAERLSEMKFKYIIANIGGCVIMTVILLLWLNSFRRSVLAIVIFTTVMSLIFYFVYLCRGEPFQLIDIYSFSTAMDVTGNYKFVYTRWTTAALVTSLCLIGWILRWNDCSIVFKPFKKIILRLIALGIMISGYFFYFNTSWNTRLGITFDLWDPKDTYEEVGTNVGFFTVAKFMKNTPPEGYSTQKAEEIAEESVEEYKEYISVNGEADVSETPVNIICIMNEAWADYTVFENFSTNEDYMPFYDSMRKNTIKGHTLVCISGGGTAKTEYEFLTGNSVKQYPGMIPYLSYFTHEEYSLVSTLKAQGYYAVAMHPSKGTNWDRVNAYNLLGFDEFITIDDFDEEAEKYRNLITDYANYEKIIEVIEGKENPSHPLFLFDITMQNHGGYETDNFDIKIKVEGYEDDAWNRYLSLAKKSDEALKYLIEYFENFDEPTMVVMFGDHFPSQDEGTEQFLSGETKNSLDVREMQKYYQTPFFIWTNYDMDSQNDVITSTNFLGTLMMRQTGLELTDYEKYELLFMSEIKAYNHKGYVTANGEYVLWDNASQEAENLLLQYEYLQYNNLMENSKRMDWFFGIGEK